MTRLVQSGVVAEDWNAGEHKGMVTDSVVVFMVREGNPKGIKTWDDLTKDGVEVMTPTRSPLAAPAGTSWPATVPSSSRARPEQAREYLSPVRERRGPGQERARVADDVRRRQGRRPPRLRERGDLAQRQGQPLEYVVPDQTILIENRSRSPRTHRSRGEGLPRLPPLTDEAQRSSATRATGRRRVRSRHVRLPDPALALHDRRSRWLGHRPGRVLRPRARASWPTCSAISASRPSSR